MKAIFSKDQHAEAIVMETKSKERIFNALILFPDTDPDALAAMKFYIDAIANKQGVSSEYISGLIREYTRMKVHQDSTHEFDKWEIDNGN